MSSSIRLQRDRATHGDDDDDDDDKYSITARWKFYSKFINSRLNVQ